jgi:CDP-diacylglycerol pyrophosphatase
VTSRLAALLLLAACAAPAPPPASRAPDPNGLLHQMQACLAETELAPPCTEVDRARGFVVIKDHSPAKPVAWLIVPDREVTGIEDPRALRPPVVDFWTYGWEVGRRLVPADHAGLALAINSQAGRSQNLLHIHISCVRPEVRQALAGASIGPDWAPEPFVRFGDSRYNARRVASLDPSPFLLLADRPGARADMGAQSLAVIGSADGGYLLLTESTEPGAPAEAEALLDEACR